MANNGILTHIPRMSSKKIQSVLPRYRMRGQSDNPEYVFAARLKRAPYWLVISKTWWGIVGKEEFELDYVTSNDESRKTHRERKEKLLD